jgi:hypothetical protein
VDRAIEVQDLVSQHSAVHAPGLEAHAETAPHELGQSPLPLPRAPGKRPLAERGLNARLRIPRHVAAEGGVDGVEIVRGAGRSERTDRHRHELDCEDVVERIRDADEERAQPEAPADAGPNALVGVDMDRNQRAIDPGFVELRQQARRRQR